MKAIKIENRKELKTFTFGRNCTTQQFENSVFVIFENTASMKLHSLCSEIGNHFGWSEADKIKKSKSEKTIIEFINKYQSFVLKYIS
jgi:hypothetical protein